MVDEIFNSSNTLKILIHFNNHKELTSSSISRELNFTVSSVIKNIDKLELKGLIVKKKFGRKKVLTLTNLGKQVSKRLIEINILLN